MSIYIRQMMRKVVWNWSWLVKSWFKSSMHGHECESTDGAVQYYEIYFCFQDVGAIVSCSTRV
jgi:hypothetical protein